MGNLGYFFGNNLTYLDSLIKRVGISVVLSVMLIATAIWAGRKLNTQEINLRTWRANISSTPWMQSLRSRLTNWVSTNRGLMLTLISGLLLAGISGWLFGALAEDVLSRDSLTLYDTGISQWLLSLVTEDGAQFFYAITLLGSTWFILTGSLAMSAWLAWRRQWLNLGALVLSIGGGEILNISLKTIFLRPGPDFTNVFYHVSGYSFPSDHAMLSILFYGILTYVISNQGVAWKTRTRLGIAALTLSTLIGFSQLFLGVHYLTDVLGGWSAGVVWLTACLTNIQALKFSRRLRVSSPV
jgi:undecaprenyl-diphosphatase